MTETPDFWAWYAPDVGFPPCVRISHGEKTVRIIARNASRSSITIVTTDPNYPQWTLYPPDGPTEFSGEEALVDLPVNVAAELAGAIQCHPEIAASQSAAAAFSLHFWSQAQRDEMLEMARRGRDITSEDTREKVALALFRIIYPDDPEDPAWPDRLWADLPAKQRRLWYRQADTAIAAIAGGKPAESRD